MILTIKANERINTVNVIPRHENEPNSDIYSIEINFDTSPIWSDIEIWLSDNDDKYKDHICMNVSKRNKLMTHK